MKALLINSLTHGGAERIVINIFNELSENKRDLLLLCLVNDNSYEVKDNGNIIYISDRKSLKRGMGIKKILLYPIVVIRLYKLIKKYNIDLIQSHLYSSSLINVLLRVLGSKHIVQIVNHSSLDYEKNFRLHGRVKRQILKFVYNSSDLVISISKKMKMDLDNSVIKKGHPHIVIPNPHNVNYIISKSNENPGFNFEKDVFYIITCGRLIKSKKVDILITVFEKISKSLTNSELIILGDGPEKDFLKAYIGKLNLQNKIHMLGHVLNPFGFLKNSDLFVMTSESEGLPNVLIEAMLSKLFIISTDCQTGPREIIAPDSDLGHQIKSGYEVYNNGILTQVNDVESIANSILYFHENQSELMNKLENTFQFAQQFSFEKIIKKYEEIIYKNDKN